MELFECPNGVSINPNKVSFCKVNKYTSGYYVAFALDAGLIEYNVGKASSAEAELERYREHVRIAHAHPLYEVNVDDLLVDGPIGAVREREVDHNG